MNILVVGSSVIDLFLRIKDLSHAEISDKNVKFLLGDKIPTSIEKLTLGGNGANVSVGLTRLTLKTTFYTYLGSDILSRFIQESIEKEGVELAIEKGEEETSSLSLIFDFPSDRIIFSHHPKHTHQFSYVSSQMLDCIYLTAIGDNWETTYDKVVNLSKGKDTQLAFSPGSYELKDSSEQFYKTLQSSKLLFINKEEAEHILKHANKEFSDVNSLLVELSKMGPSIVSITDGENGAFAISSDKEIFRIASFGGKAVEKTGAGDAYATGFLAAYLLGKPIDEAMRWGTFNSSSVMMSMGAQEGLLRNGEMIKNLNTHPDFKAEKIS